jgi:ABC-2 type transport system permease protein
MNTPPNAMPDSSVPSPVAASASRWQTRPLYWSIRRELWESRSIYLAPLAVAAVTLLGFLIATIGRALSISDLARRQAVLEEHYTFATGVVMVTVFIVSIFYSLDALYGERRDRSILFWKSLPVSDLTTVLAKAGIALVILPLLAFAITVAMEWIMLLLSTLVLLGSGLSAGTLWTQTFGAWLVLLYHLITVHMLWYAPLYGWLLLVSAWARRVVFLWAALPLLAIGVLEKILFNTTHFAAWLSYRLSGPEPFAFQSGVSSTHATMHLDPGKFLSTPGLWAGLAVAALFLAAAIRLRRYRDPI